MLPAGGAAPAVGYRYFRLNITKMASGSGPSTSGQPRVNELVLKRGGVTIVPVGGDPMTNYTAPPPGVVTESSNNGAGYEGWRAFDGDPSDASRWAPAGGAAPHWLTYDVGAANASFDLPDSMEIVPDGAVSSGYYLVDFQLLASETGAFAGEEVVVVSIYGQVQGNWSNNTRRVFPVVPDDSLFNNRTAIWNFTEGDYLDHSKYAETVTPIGTIVLDPDDGIVLDGSSHALSLPDRPRWAQGSDGGIQIEGLKLASGGRTQYIICQRDAGVPLWVLLINSSNVIGAAWLNSSGANVLGVNSNVSLTPGVLYDQIAFRVAGGIPSLHINGVDVSTAQQSLLATLDLVDPLTLFSQGGGDNTVRLGGTVKGIRLTQGIPAETSWDYPFPVAP